MGGYGSGRRGYKQKAEDCRSLDINRLNREGCLQSGWQGSWIWSTNGTEVGRINCKAAHRLFTLDYRVRQHGGDWESVTQSIPVTYADCNYGNQRPYFLCSGVINGNHCGRRVGKLFAGGKYFLCRHCYNIAYNCQSEPRYDRALRRANKTRMTLGGKAGTVHWIPKPKGMWQRTYQRHRMQIERDEYQANQHFLSKYSHILSREEREMYFGT